MPKWSQKLPKGCPKGVPKQIQNPLEFTLGGLAGPWIDLGEIWEPLGVDLGSILRSKAKPEEIFQFIFGSKHFQSILRESVGNCFKNGLGNIQELLENRFGVVRDHAAELFWNPR